MYTIVTGMAGCGKSGNSVSVLAEFGPMFQHLEYCHTSHSCNLINKENIIYKIQKQVQNIESLINKLLIIY